MTPSAIKPRAPTDAGYLGPRAEAERQREIMQARAASPMRARAIQLDTPSGGLFGPPSLSLF